MKKRIFKLGSVLVVFALVVCAVASTAWANPKNQVYVIGDSLSDSGNLYELTGYFPPSPYAQRFSNGPVWAEYFADQLGVNLDDRAYGGAFTGVIDLTSLGLGEFSNLYSIQYSGAPYFLPPDLPGVKEEVDKLLADCSNSLNPDALYVIWAGANDVFLYLDLVAKTGDPLLFDWILADAVQNIANTLCTLSAAGAKHFVVANLPDIGLTPFGQSLGADGAAMVSLLVDQFNQALEAALAALPPDGAQTLVIIDVFQSLQELISSPEAYGLVNVDTPCIDLGFGADCSQYLFWDTVHPTTYGHALLAERFRAAFCGTGDQHPGLRGRPDGQPPPIWRGVCYGSK